MKGRGASLIRAAGAFATTVGLVVGVPLLLVATVGNPLPRDLPSIDEVRILLTQNGDGFTNFLLSGLAVIAWITWIQLVIALAVEIVATARRRETRRLPTAPGIQAFAAQLVAAMALATTLTAGPMLAPVAGALSFDDVVSSASSVVQIIEAEDSNVQPRLEAAGQIIEHDRSPPQFVDAATWTGSTLVLQDHTELWDLAEAAYGDGTAWSAIANANAGLFDGAGVRITNETESVAPGTELMLPGSPDVAATTSLGAPSQATETGVAAETAATHVVQSGDSLWSMAETHVEETLDRSATDAEVGAYWADLVKANEAVVRSGDVDLIYPGEELSVPGAVRESANATGEAPSTEDPVSDPQSSPDREAIDLDVLDEIASPEAFTDELPESSQGSTAAEPESPAEASSPEVEAESRTGAAKGPAQATEVSAPVEPSSDRADTPPVAPDTVVDNSGLLPAAGLATAGAAMLSAGIVAAIRRRRDLQRRTRPAGTAARSAATDAAAFEAAAAYASHELRESQLGVGWRMMPSATVAAMRAAGPLEIHADRAGAVTGVATVTTEHGTEHRAIDLTLTETSEPDLEDLLGRPTKDLDIEPAEPGEAKVPTTVVLGTDSAGDAVLLDLDSVGTLELVGSTAGIQRVARSAVLDLAVSDRADDVRVVGVRIAHELDDLDRVQVVGSVEQAARQIERSGHGLDTSGTPVVVVSAAAVDINDPDYQELRRRGVIVLAPGLGGDNRLEIDGDRATLRPGGTEIRLAALDDDAYQAVGELVETTSSMAIELVDETRSVHDVIDVARTNECAVEPGPIEVKVLGPVEIAGAEHFSSLKAVDVIAYLAFHRNGTDADQIKTWVWPPFDPPTDKAFANVMSRARTALGANGDGEPLLSRAGSGKTYRLDPAVTTDFDRFRALVRLADEATSDDATLEMLRQAIELIRGVPFTGGAASSFTWADNHVRAQVEYTIDEAVHRCADLALHMNNLAVARWAALKGHELVPGCEQCFRRRFLIAGAGRNRSELRRAMADLEASAMVDMGEPEAIDMISADLLELFHELDRTLVGGSTSTVGS